MRRAVDEFHIHYEKAKLWDTTSWMGVPCWKLPFDAFVIQELIFQIRPEYIIETGTGKGGSSVFYASICELLGEGKVITVDIEQRVDHDLVNKFHWTDRIKFMGGSSTNPLVLDEIVKECKGKRNLVILDSYHTYEHVRLEMEKYSKLVPVGSYMIVEDTHANGHPVPWQWGAGPYEAVDNFLSIEGDSWEADYNCERYMMTFNPKGYLKRVKE